MDTSNFYKKHLPTFLALAFAYSWGIFGIAYLLTMGKLGMLAMTITGVAFMFGPMLAAFTLQYIHQKKIVGADLMIHFKTNSWFLVAWLLMPAYALLSFALSLLLPGVEYDPEMTGMFERFANNIPAEQLAVMKEQQANLPVPVMLLTLFQALLAGPTINAVFAFGEEVGWRAFMLKAFQGQGFWKSSFLIGAVWGLWHAPLILMGHNYPQHPILGVLMMFLWCVLLSPLFTYITLRTNSVIAAAIMHGTLNASAGLAILYVKGSSLLVGVSGLAGMLVLALLLLLLQLFDSRLPGGGICKKNILDSDARLS